MGLTSQDALQARGVRIGAAPPTRPEALEDHRNQWLGSNRMAQPLSSWLMVVVSLVVGVTLLAFIYLGNMTRKPKVIDISVPSSGSLIILAPHGGVLVRALATEEQGAGQPLFEFSIEREREQGEVATLVATAIGVVIGAASGVVVAAGCTALTVGFGAAGCGLLSALAATYVGASTTDRIKAMVK